LDHQKWQDAFSRRVKSVFGDSGIAWVAAQAGILDGFHACEKLVNVCPQGFGFLTCEGSSFIAQGNKGVSQASALSALGSVKGLLQIHPQLAQDFILRHRIRLLPAGNNQGGNFSAEATSNRSQPTML